jgi:hypothetical protein
MALGSCHLKMVTISQGNSFQTTDKAMGTTSGQIKESFRGGGTKINSMELGFTSVLMRLVSSLGCGRWAGASNGLQMLRVT